MSVFLQTLDRSPSLILLLAARRSDVAHRLSDFFTLRLLSAPFSPRLSAATPTAASCPCSSLYSGGCRDVQLNAKPVAHHLSGRFTEIPLKHSAIAGNSSEFTRGTSSNVFTPPQPPLLFASSHDLEHTVLSSAGYRVIRQNFRPNLAPAAPQRALTLFCLYRTHHLCSIGILLISYVTRTSMHLALENEWQSCWPERQERLAA